MTWQRFVRNVLAVGVVSLVSHGAGAESGSWLELTSLHTRETVRVTFRPDGSLEAADVMRLEHVLRDYRADETHSMDPGLYDQLRDLAAAAGREPRFEVISGYRSAATNAKLRAQGHAVAEHSQHILGHAIDMRLKDFPLDKLHELAVAAHRGGVGYYPASNFIHIDTGRVRSWDGR